MRFAADAMSQPVTKRLAVAGRFDHLARRLIDLPALERPPAGKRLAQQINGRVTGPHDHPKQRFVFLWHALADKTDSCVVAVHGIGLIELGSAVE